MLLPFDNRDELQLWARRQVASGCVYGVDINPLAVEMARLSLWLITLGKDVPFSFLDHALKCGDSLVGASRRQLEGWSLADSDEDHLPLSFEAVDSALHLASAARREVEALPVLEARDAETKAATLARADVATRWLRLAGDLLVAPSFAVESKSEQRELRNQLLDEFAAAVQSGDPAPLRQRADALLDQQRTLHWFAELPEVFEEGGFDAVVGNPPFLGGQRISGVLGGLYRDHLVEVLAGGQKGSADLVSYFFLRAAGLLQPQGCMGLLATNTIAQGDTREVGLDQLVAGGLSIYQAVKSRPWPGDASVEVSVVHLARDGWAGSRKLEGDPVERISTNLDAGPTGKPRRLALNRELSFQGSTVLGMGFVLSPEEAEELIRKDSRNAEVLQPYLNGHDLNSHPEQKPSRWVINFRDWPLERAEQYPDLISIVREQVKPERDSNKRKTYRVNWWNFAEKRPALYRTIHPLSRVLACAQTSAHWVPAFLPKGIVYSHTVVVFALPNSAQYAVMQSTIHETWKLQHGPTLRNDPRYTPSDCFETFPFPHPDPRTPIPGLEPIGEAYHETRRGMMLERQVGLTSLYNLFHIPSCADADIAGLQRLHAEMDAAVAAAYGWSDLELGHAFHENERGQPRHTIAPEARSEILRRLLALNRQRHEQEAAQGLHAKKSKPKKPPKLPPSQAGAPSTRPRQKGLWENE